jgi:hypothetical protein
VNWIAEIVINIATFFSNITAPDFEELAFALGTLLTWVESHTMAVD